MYDNNYKKIVVLRNIMLIFFASFFLNSCEELDLVRDNKFDYKAENYSWQQISDFKGEPRHGAVSFTINGKAYIGLGLSISSNTGQELFYNDFWCYDPEVDTWTQVADYPGGGRAFATAFSINNQGYVGTGSKGYEYLKDFYKYDPFNDSWIRIADLEGSARDLATGFSINGKGYICFGYYHNNNWLSDLWEYTPSSDTWEQKSSFSYSKGNAVSFNLNNQTYIGLGRLNARRYQDFYIYNQINDSWEFAFDLEDLGIVRYSSIPNYTFAINNKLYLGFGHSDSFVYEPETNFISKIEDLIYMKRYMPVFFSIDNHGFIGLGQVNDSSVKDFWKYTP